MPTSLTYSTLKQAIKDGIEDQGTDFDAQVDLIIKQGEDDLVRDLPLSIFDAKDQDVAITAGSQTATKPSGCISTRELVYTSGSRRYVLVPRQYGFLKAAYPDTTQRVPRFYADDYSETLYYIAPAPNLSVTAKADVVKRQASIVTATTTFLGTNVGDLLLASCMVVAERFGLGWAESKNWADIYATKLGSARIDLRHLLRRDYATLAPQPMALGKGER